MKITKITPQKRQGFYNIFIDDVYSFSISESSLSEEGLKVGQLLSNQDLEHLKFKGHYSHIYNKVLNFLSFRPRTVQETRQRIRKYLHDATELTEELKLEIEELVIQKLVNLQFLNDSEFTKWLIKLKTEGNRPWGVNRIKSYLYKAGISKSLIADSLENMQKANPTHLVDLAEKKAKSLKAKDVYDFKKKLAGYLQRQGYTWDDISPVIDTIVKNNYNNSSLDVN